ncbi:MAG: DUF4328 domain-containing protein [Phycicoccus sp.]
MTTDEIPTPISATSSAMAGVPIGWYADPEDRSRLRKWDGHRWTDSWMTRPSGWSATPVPSVPTRMAAGWYRDPSRDARTRWWDGAAWTSRVRTGRVFPGREPLTPGFFRLTNVVAALLALHAVLLAVGAVVALWYYPWLQDVASDPAAHSDAEVLRNDLLWAAATLPQRIVLLAVAACFLLWLWRLHGSDRVDPDLLGHSRGWVIGAWFVPVLWFVRPYVVVADLRRAAASAAGVTPAPGRTLVLSWWFAVLGSSIVGATSAYLMSHAADDAVHSTVTGTLAGAQWTWVASSLLGASAAALAVVVVRGIASTVRGRESDDPLPPTGPPPA